MINYCEKVTLLIEHVIMFQIYKGYSFHFAFLAQLLQIFKLEVNTNNKRTKQFKFDAYTNAYSPLTNMLHPERR
jgi:hypothetical protein